MTPSAGRAAITEGTRRRGPSGASAATSADPATLPAAISAIAVRRENDGTRLAPTWKVVATMLAPTKIRNRSAVDCVWPAGCDGTDVGGVHGARFSMYLDATLVGRYRINIIMPKQAISVTLDSDNLTWLKGRAGAAGLRSVSELLDQLVTAARDSGRVGPSRSVVGTIDIDANDPLLEGADDAIRGLYETALRRPLVVRERPAEYRAPAARKKGRRG